MMPQLLVAAVVFVAVTLLVYAAANAWGAERRLVMDRISRHGGTAAVATGGSAGQATATLLADNEFSSFESFNRMLKKSGYAERVAHDLSRAAVPLRVGEYLLIRWIVAVALCTIIVMVLHLNVLVGVVLGLGGYFLPRLYVSRKEKSRIHKFEEQMVDALVMMANALKSGSSFLQAMDLVAHEQPAPICQEFARVVAEANVGASIENSLLDVGLRVRSYDLYLVVTAMLVQREVGGNLSEVLENIAHTIRERQRILRQVVVETAETRLSGYVVGALPIFMLFMMMSISPSYISVLLTGFGQVILIVGGIMEVLGFYVISRVVDIDV